MKWNESGFRPPLCTYRLNWARRTSWGWWDGWADTLLQTQDSKFMPLRSEAEHATSRSRRLPTILTFTRRWGRNIFLFLLSRRDRTPNSGVKGSGVNQRTTLMKLNPLPPRKTIFFKSHQTCIVLYCIVLYCIVLCCVVLCCVVLCCVVLCCVVLCCVVLCCVVLCCVVLCCIVLYCIVLYCIVLYCIVLYCIVLYGVVSCRVVLYYRQRSSCCQCHAPLTETTVQY